MRFEWDTTKEQINIEKHGVDFETAKAAFTDSKRVIVPDTKHSRTEARFFCFGKVNGRVLTVRFTIRRAIRIIGAAYWRMGKKIYEDKN